MDAHAHNQHILSKKERKRYLREVGLQKEIVKQLKKPKKAQQLQQVDYTVYQPNSYGKLANRVCASSHTIEKIAPTFSKNLGHTLRMADCKVLSHTYVNMMVLTIVIAGIIAALGTGGVLYILNFPLTIVLIGTGSATVGVALLTLILFIAYPSLQVGKRNRMIKNDLPFAIIHMAAVAGSGAEPMAMFRLLLNANEYKGLESDIKRIVNYVNLFGYDLSTALKTVAATTSLKRWKDILTGITTTIESGGSLKSYLKSIADDTMNTYRLERKKYVESLATYSDIYISILIAAPLLFIVTLAIINILGGTIGGISVGVLAMAGTYIVIPFLNIAFIIFLNIVNPEK